MSTYLDIERFAAYVNRHHASEAQRSERMVGLERSHDSWYFDIVKFFGTARIDPAAIQIEYEKTPFVQRDALIAAYTRQIETVLRAEGRLYDGPPALQITGADWNSRSIRVRSIRYGEQAAGFALDLVDPAFETYGGTLRDYLRITYPSTRLEDSPLCAGVGVCGLLIVSDADRKYVLRVRRSSKLASLENTVGPSVAGSVEYAEEYRNLAELIERSMAREVEEELGFAALDYRITPLAYAREMVRGNRPQLFAVIETTLSRLQVSDRISALPEAKREFSEFAFLPLAKGRQMEADIAAFNFEAKMCYYLWEEFSELGRRQAPKGA